MALFEERIALLITASTKGAVTELDKLEKSSKGAASQWEKTSSALVAGAKAFVGVGLAVAIQQSVDAYADAARGANLLAEATNATVEESSRFLAVVGRYGLGINDLTEIFSDFQQASAKSADELAQLGVQVVKNADGTTNWVKTTVNFLQVMQKIPDATERNRLMFKYFGEEGAKQLMGLVNSGLDLADAMAAVQKYQIFTADDVRRAVAYDEAMKKFTGSMQGVQFALGQMLAPALTVVADAFSQVLGILTQIPDSFVFAGGAVLVYSKLIKAELVQGALLALRITLAEMPSILAGMAGGLRNVGGAAKAAGSALLTMAASAGPLILLAAAVVAVTEAMKVAGERQGVLYNPANLNKSLKEQAQILHDTDSAWSSFTEFWATPLWSDTDIAVQRLNTNMQRLTKETEKNAKATLENADATDTQKAAAQNLLDIMGSGTLAQKTANLATDEGTQAMGEYSAAVGGLAGVQELATLNTGNLNDLLAEGKYSQEDLADAVNLAGQAQADQNAITEKSNDLMEIYAANTRDAVDATLAMFDKTFALHKAQKSFNDDLDKNLGVLSKTKKGSDDWVEAMDNIASGMLDISTNTAEAQRQQDQLNGVYHDAAYYSQLQIDQMKELADADGIPKNVKDSIYDNFITPMEQAQAKAEGGILIGDVKFKSGTTEDQVKKIQDDIDRALADHDYVQAGHLQAQLDELKLPAGLTDEVQNIKVDITDSAGNPLPDQKDIALNVTTTGVDEAQASVDALPKDVPIGIDYMVANNSLDRINGYNEDLDGKVLTTLVEYKVAGDSLDRINQYNDDLDGKWLTINVQYKRFNSVPPPSDYNPPGPIGGWPLAATTNNYYSVTVSGAGSPEQTARGIDRYFRRAGNPQAVSVTA